MLTDLRIKANSLGNLQRRIISEVLRVRSRVLLLLLLAVCANAQENKPIFAPVVYIKNLKEKTILRVPPEKFYHDSLSAYNARLRKLTTIDPYIFLVVDIERVILVSPNGFKVSKKK